MGDDLRTCAMQACRERSLKDLLEKGQTLGSPPESA